MALHTQKRRKREEQRAEETELTGNICSMCLPPSGREFAPHAGWSALASLPFLLRFGCTRGSSAWSVRGSGIYSSAAARGKTTSLGTPHIAGNCWSGCCSTALSGSLPPRGCSTEDI